ncbi:MAG: hypothetical protein MR210_07940 [Erysipelotrichaceae bacterium]|nr:hypothetical protein [Erysipelotrichaceae bacterium]MDY5251329.1 hypothetical protein [Erysipelotrichaceae bacterium]
MVNDIYACLEFVIVDIKLEVILDINRSMYDNLLLLQKMIDQLKYYDFLKVVLFEKYTNIKLDPYQPLNKVGLYEGINIIIY